MTEQNGNPFRKDDDKMVIQPERITRPMNNLASGLETAQVLLETMERLAHEVAPRMGVTFDQHPADYDNPEDAIVLLVCPWCETEGTVTTRVFANLHVENDYVRSYSAAEIEFWSRSVQSQAFDEIHKDRLICTKCRQPVRLPEGWVVTP